MNARAVFDRLRRGGPASRAELAKATGLSTPTVGKVVDSLLAGGLLEVAESTPGSTATHVLERGERTGTLGDSTPSGGSGGSGGGRPGQPLRLAREVRKLVVVQLGVRTTRLAALAVAGPENEAWPVEFPTPRDLRTLQHDLAEAARQLGTVRPWAVMLSVPGVVDETAGRVLFSPNLHWIENIPAPELCADIWRAPVHLVQEIRALALGQLHAEPEVEDFLLVDFGQGVGGAVVTGGKLFAAPLPLSGELGHTPVRGNDRVCGCGATGCIETLAARPGLVQSFALVHPLKNRSWPTLVRHVRQAGVESWLEETLQATGTVIGGALNVLGVRRVIITGALAELGEPALTVLAQTVQKSAMWGRFGQVECTMAPRRRALGLVAAAIDRVLLPAQA